MGIFRGRVALLIGLIIGTTSGLSAKRLDRVDATEPVLPNQPIPVIDFFRPHFLEHRG